MRRLHTGVPPEVERSSGSCVRFPVRTTRLMFVAAIGGTPLLLLVRAVAGLSRGQARVPSRTDRKAAVNSVFAVKSGVVTEAATRRPRRPPHGRPHARHRGARGRGAAGRRDAGPAAEASRASRG